MYARLIILIYSLKLSRMKLTWTPEHDQILRNVANSLEKPINWKKAIPILKLYPDFQNRSSKECRQRQLKIKIRWTNMLDINAHDIDWTEKQEQILLQKHSLIGNKWLQLSKYFPERSQNFLKNQFYSIFRRALRRANKQIYLYKGNSIRPITTAIVLKVLSTCEYKFDNRQDYPESLVEAACAFKQVLVEYCRPCADEVLNKQRIGRFLKSINLFRKEFRDKNSKARKQKVKSKKQKIRSHPPSGQEIRTLNEKKIETVQSNISSTLFHSDQQMDKEFIKQVETVHAPIQPMITQIFFPKMTFAEMGGIVQEQIPLFSYQTPFFEPFTHGMFTMIKEVPLSLENSLLFYNNLRKQEGLQGSGMVHSNFSIDFGVKQQE